MIWGHRAVKLAEPVSPDGLAHRCAQAGVVVDPLRARRTQDPRDASVARAVGAGNRGGGDSRDYRRARVPAPPIHPQRAEVTRGRATVLKRDALQGAREAGLRGKGGVR